MNPVQNRHWLMRHVNRNYSRPMNESELFQLFNSGELSPQDEICPSFGYWFLLSDVEEMRKHFGNIPMDRIFKKSEDVTQEHFADTGKVFVDRTKLNPSPARKTQPTPIQTAHSPSSTAPSGWVKIVLALITLMILGMIYFWFF